MNNGLILFASLGIMVIVGLIIQYFLWKSRMNDKNAINEDWRNFLNASSNNNISQISYYGDKLIWNKFLKQEQLTELTKVVDSKIDKYPELEKLKLDAFNKQLHYNRILPEIGSSGGIKQSW